MFKGHELLTVPVANKDLWTWRPFLIFQVEFELALGIWLLSGVFKRLAWLGALACFSLFCSVTLYKALVGAASCGCFGTVHVNPWITLFAVDLPAVVILGLLRPPAVVTSLWRSTRLAWRATRLLPWALHSRARVHLATILDRSVPGLRTWRFIITAWLVVAFASQGLLVGVQGGYNIIL